MKRLALIVLLAMLTVVCGLALYSGLRDDAGAAADAEAATTAEPTAELVARGAYLARAGDCMACHTVRGGAPYAGGRAIQTPFGAIPSPN
ncbi:MAG: cytochrome c, partial [Noviherbaspirillum sp.]